LVTEYFGIHLFDIDNNQARKFASTQTKWIKNIFLVKNPRQVIQSSNMILFATTAGEPWIFHSEDFAHNPDVLHLSLRDIAPEIVINANNIVDDIDHCLRENTSLHLAESMLGNRDFVTGTLASLMRNTGKLRSDRPSIFSPFGMGMLDLAVASFVFEEAKRLGKSLIIPKFSKVTEEVIKADYVCDTY